ncbi:MAG: hypothetical protein ACXAC5_22915 [Promethearchaeota archaeon]|jgi:uncharacterized membrane protein (DUF106 family)
MSNVAIILQILGITIGMIILGMVLNKILGLSKEKMADFREKALNIQERMRNAQLVGDVRMQAQLQRETLQFTKRIMLKQFVPLCIRCVIFLVIFGILGLIYAEYDRGLLPFPILFLGNGWIALYFIFSISFSLIIYALKKLYKRITGKLVSTQGNLREIMELISPTQRTSGMAFQVSETASSRPSRITTTNAIIEDESDGKPDSWKDRIEK